MPLIGVIPMNYGKTKGVYEVRTYLGINKNTKIILITSAEMNEGKTTIACNIATCFSELETQRSYL